MNPQILSNIEAVSYYKSEHRIDILREISTSSVSESPIEVIRGQIISEIEGMRKLRKKLREQYPDLLVYAKP